MTISVRIRWDLSGMQKLQQIAQRKEAKALGYIAGYIRRVAMSSMKKGTPGQVSMPGLPPWTWNERYKKSIQYAYDRGTRSVVIGGIPFGSVPIPGFIERGGMELITDRRTGQMSAGLYRPRPAMRLAFAVALQQRKVQEAMKDYIQL